ncbi:hypothetical protein RCO48_08155 [Peribacillus frigoritolerans]|nr:hypothetical protein [Peribacillus frigoritolerans]
MKRTECIECFVGFTEIESNQKGVDFFLKVMGIRLLLMAFLLAIFELIVINIAGILPFLAAHQGNISGAPLMAFVIENLMNPIGTSTSMIEKKNPPFLMGSAAVIVLAVFMVFFYEWRQG